MERTAVNPVPWSTEMGFNQGEMVSGHTRTLYCSGQAAMSDDGEPRHPGDMAAQLAPASTLLGVTRLAIPVLMVELEATAVA